MLSRFFLGACNQDDWIGAVRPVIEKRIQKYSEGEIRFNLMAIVSDRKMIYEQKIAELQRQLAEVCGMFLREQFIVILRESICFSFPSFPSLLFKKIYIDLIYCPERC